LFAEDLDTAGTSKQAEDEEVVNTKGKSSLPEVEVSNRPLSLVSVKYVSSRTGIYLWQCNTFYNTFININ
jgi:hypothetical protein